MKTTFCHVEFTVNWDPKPLEDCIAQNIELIDFRKVKKYKRWPHGFGDLVLVDGVYREIA